LDCRSSKSLDDRSIANHAVQGIKVLDRASSYRFFRYKAHNVLSNQDSHVIGHSPQWCGERLCYGSWAEAIGRIPEEEEDLQSQAVSAKDERDLSFGFRGTPRSTLRHCYLPSCFERRRV
jgi:hypothetical protein